VHCGGGIREEGIREEGIREEAVVRVSYIFRGFRSVEALKGHVSGKKSIAAVGLFARRHD
jgi:hypothetical protein